MRPWIVVMLAALVLVAFTGEDYGRRTYSPAEVAAAFAAQGLPLTEWKPPTGVRASEGAVLEPRKPEPFLVLVVTDREAADAWKGYVLVGPDTDSFDARRANVVLISDGGMSEAAKHAARAAMSELPDRGDRVGVIRQG
jgi:hypothetical protein